MTDMASPAGAGYRTSMMANTMTLQMRLIEIATQGDAAWFETHPDNRIRIRNAVAGEFNEDFGQAPVGMSWRAIVLEAQPGMRMRQPVALPLHVDNDLSDQDLFALFMQAAVNRPGFVGGVGL